MSTPSILRYQQAMRDLRRSMRRFIPVIASRTGYSAGVITCYLDGHGTDLAKYQAIASVLEAITAEQAAKQQQLELEAKQEQISGPSRPHRKYRSQYYV